MDNNLSQEKTEIVPETTQSNTSTTEGSPTFDFSQKSIVAALSYVGPLIIIPYMTNREDPFTHFHIKQGLVVLILDIILWVFGMFAFMLLPILSIINLGLIILSIIGIINALQRKEKKLPLVGNFADQIKL